MNCLKQNRTGIQYSKRHTPPSKLSCLSTILRHKLSKLLKQTCSTGASKEESRKRCGFANVGCSFVPPAFMVFANAPAGGCGNKQSSGSNPKMA